MKYKNGFYTYFPSKDAQENMDELSTPQVIQVIEGEVWLTGINGGWEIDYVDAIGRIGDMVMGEDGSVINQLNKG